jgi:hypothetical protein
MKMDTNRQVQVSLMPGAKDFPLVAPTLQVLELVMYRWDVRKKREREEGGRGWEEELVGVGEQKSRTPCRMCMFPLFTTGTYLSRVLSATYCESDLDHVEEKKK